MNNIVKSVKTKFQDYSYQLLSNRIKKEWKKAPAKLLISRLDHHSISSFPKKVDKDEIVIGFYTYQEGKDQVLITKHDAHFCIPLDTLVISLSYKDLKELGLFPKDLFCRECKELSTKITIDGMCGDCI